MATRGPSSSPSRTPRPVRAAVVPQVVQQDLQAILPVEPQRVQYRTHGADRDGVARPRDGSSGVDQERAGPHHDPDHVGLALLAVCRESLIATQHARSTVQPDVPGRLGPRRHVVQGDLPLDGPLIDRAPSRRSGEGRIRVHAFGPEQVERLIVVDLRHEPRRDHGVPALDGVGHGIVVNSDLLPDV